MIFKGFIFVKLKKKCIKKMVFKFSTLSMCLSSIECLHEERGTLLWSCAQHKGSLKKLGKGTGSESSLEDLSVHLVAPNVEMWLCAHGLGGGGAEEEGEILHGGEGVSLELVPCMLEWPLLFRPSGSCTAHWNAGFQRPCQWPGHWHPEATHKCRCVI